MKYSEGQDNPFTQLARGTNTMASSVAPRPRRSRSDDALTTYLDEISVYPLLSRGDETALAEQARKGDAEALERLVCSNLRFVVSVAKRYRNQGVALSDLINEGNLGLITAAERFDETKGVRFISYAVWWIRQSIFQAMAEQGHAVRVPLSRAGTLYRIGRRAEILRQELGREPTQREIIAGMDLTEREAQTNMPMARPTLSLDAPLSSDDEATLLDYLPDDGGSAPDEDASGRGLAESLNEAMATQLRSREATVLRMYFGFGDGEAMTLEEIGAQLGITRERVRQIKEKALTRLRKSSLAPALASFHEH